MTLLQQIRITGNIIFGIFLITIILSFSTGMWLLFIYACIKILKYIGWL